MTRPIGPSGMRYEPIAQIGRGGMAEVLLARVHAVGGVRRLAVLKRIWPELATDSDFVTMFMDEARLSLRLNHPNVVQTHEVLSGAGELAIAMEYLDGQPLTGVLNRLLRGGELSLPLRLRILTNVLAGLEHAHTLTDLDGTPLEVVHRDVSPQNVFITYDGQVKLVDFGVAKTLAASHQTRPGTLKGKLAYMAPEQLQRVAIDCRADLFAVGVMLWEMLAGRRMWHRMTEVEIVAHLASGQPLPPLPLDASRPPILDTICARALDSDPAGRYDTAAEMEMDLESALVGVADSHLRNLGKVVSLAFAAERAERQALIEPWVRPSAPVLSVVRTPPPETPHNDVPVARPMAMPADAPAIDVDLSGLVSGPISVPPPARGPVWLRGSAALLALGAIVAGSLVAGGWRYAPGSGVQSAAAAPTAQAHAASVPAAAPNGAGVRPTIGRRPEAAGFASDAPDEATRPRRRHHHRVQGEGDGTAAAAVDDDATLPLTEDDPGQ